jgi:hypothetical protein
MTNPKRNRVITVLEGISFLTALAAAVFWGWAAIEWLPAPGTYWDKSPEIDPFLMVLRHCANLNSIAAMLTGISVVILLAGRVGMRVAGPQLGLSGRFRKARAYPT